VGPLFLLVFLFHSWHALYLSLSIYSADLKQNLTRAMPTSVLGLGCWRGVGGPEGAAGGYEVEDALGTRGTAPEGNVRPHNSMVHLKIGGTYMQHIWFFTHP
jgi:hypothetical protein